MAYDKIIPIVLLIPVIVPLACIYLLAPYFLPSEVIDSGPYTIWSIIVTILYMFGTGVLLMLGFFLIPLIARANAISFLGRRNLGIVEVSGKGKTVTRDIVDFNQEVAIIGNGVFYLNPDAVYRKEGCPTIHFNEVDALDPVEYKAGKLTEKEYKTLPKYLRRLLQKKQHDFKIYLHPVSFEKDKPQDKKRNPELINGIFMKQKALAEAQAMWDEQKIKMLLIGALIIAAVAAALAYQNFDTITNKVIPLLERLVGAIK